MMNEKTPCLECGKLKRAAYRLCYTCDSIRKYERGDTPKKVTAPTMVPTGQCYCPCGCDDWSYLGSAFCQLCGKVMWLPDRVSLATHIAVFRSATGVTSVAGRRRATIEPSAEET